MNEAPEPVEPEDEHDENDREFHNGDEDDLVPIGVGARLHIQTAATRIDIEADSVKGIQELLQSALDAVSKLQTNMQ